MRELIRMISSAGTGHFYTTDKNKRTTPDKLEKKMFDPRVRKHVIYKDIAQSYANVRIKRVDGVKLPFDTVSAVTYDCTFKRDR